jgi:2,4-dienoyl-CoA reductase (NADPH2)
LLLLHRGGHEVTLVGKAKKPGRDVNPSYIWRYMSKLKEGKAVLATLTKVEEITPEGVAVTTAEGPKVLPADTVILAEVQSVQDLIKARKGVRVLGDAMLARRANAAILDGYRLGMRL